MLKPRDAEPLRRTDPVLPVSSGHGIEEFCLGVLMRHPQYTFRMDRALKRAGLVRLSASEFQDSGHQDMMRVILHAVDQDFDVPQHVVIGSLPLNLHTQADLILEKTDELPENEGRLLEELLRAILDLRKRNIQERISHVRYLMQDAQESGDMLVAEYMKTMQELMITKRAIDKALQQTFDRTILNG